MCACVAGAHLRPKPNSKKTSHVEPETETETETPQSLSGSGGLPAMCSAAAGERREGAKQTGGGSSVRASSRDGLTLLYYTERMFALGPFWKGHGDRGVEGVRGGANNEERTDPGRHSSSNSSTAQLASSVERDRTLS